MFLLEPLLIAWLVKYFTPLQNLIFKYIKNQTILQAVTCFKCLSFWITIIFTLTTQFSLYPAIINSIIAYIFERIDNQIPTKL